MEEDPSRQQVASVREDIAGLSSADEEFAAQELNYGQVSSAEEEEYEHQEWSGSPSEKCNLIVNYLPHEIDDVTLKVWASASLIFNMTLTLFGVILISFIFRFKRLCLSSTVI